MIAFDSDFEYLLVCSVRYGIARKSSNKDRIIEYASRYLRKISLATLRILEDDLEWYFKFEAMRDKGRKKWDTFSEAIKDEIRSR